MGRIQDYGFDDPVDRSGTDSCKWDRYRGRDVIPMWVADMDFRSPQPVIEALRRRVEHGVFGYGEAPAGLVRAVQDALRSEYGWEVPEEWLLWLPGLVTGLNVVCRAIGGPGDEVVTFTPIYPPFLTAPGLAGRRCVRVPLVCSFGRWEMDFEALEAALTPRCRLLLLCSPHNPTGRVWSQDELTTLLEVAERHDLVVASDEIHAGLVLDEHRHHLPFATLGPAAARRTITLLAPSKTYNIPGLGCSFAIVSDPDLRAAVCRAAEGIVPHVNVLGFVAAQAAYEQGEPWRRSLLAYLRGNRDLVEAVVPTLSGLALTHVEATYLAWIDARGAHPADPTRFFEEAGVGLSGGSDFGAPGFVRLNFGCNRALLQEALGRMERALSARVS